MNHIRKATERDLARIAEIEIFNYRLNFYPLFQNDDFYFGELQVPELIRLYQQDDHMLQNTFVYDDGVVKGFIRVNGARIEKLFVEPALQNQGIGSALLRFAISEKDVHDLWALEKNVKAIAFYQRHGFVLTNERALEEGTTEYLIRLER